MSKRGLPVAVMEPFLWSSSNMLYIRGNNDLVKNKFNGYFVQSYKDVPNKIHYLKLETNYTNLSLNASRSINRDFTKQTINLKIYKIMKNYSKHKLHSELKIKKSKLIYRN